MKNRIFTAFLSILLMLTLVAPAYAAAPAQSVADIFNAAPLTPRQSTNPDIAKPIKEIAGQIGIDSKTLSTKQKTDAVIKWVSENLAISASQYTSSSDNPYIEGAALYGLKNKKGPCEVDSAIFYYLFGYIGLDARWARGEKSSGAYHMWTEVLIGGYVFAFDTFPGQEMSYTHRTSTTMGETVVNGFTITGYYVSGTPTATAAATFSNVGDMPYMDPPLQRSQGGQVATIDMAFPDGTKLSWSFPFISKRQMAMASEENKFYNATDSADWQAFDKQIFIGPYSWTRDPKDKVMGVLGKTVTVYTVKVGTVISLAGSWNCFYENLTVVDGKLQFAGAGRAKFGVDLTLHDPNRTPVSVGGGKSYPLNRDGDRITLDKEGYGVLALTPWHPYYANTDTKSSRFGEPTNTFLYTDDSYAVIQVVK